MTASSGYINVTWLKRRPYQCVDQSQAPNRNGEEPIDMSQSFTHFEVLNRQPWLYSPAEIDSGPTYSVTDSNGCA